MASSSSSSRIPLGHTRPPTTTTSRHNYYQYRGVGDRSPESYRTLHERTSAAEILQSYEQLSWHSFMRNESPMQTRLHFQNVIAGFTADDEARMVDWKEDLTPHPPKPGEEGQARSRKKGKERVSLGAEGSPRGKGKEGSSAGGGGGGVGGSSAAKKKRKSTGGGGGSRA